MLCQTIHHDPMQYVENIEYSRFLCFLYLAGGDDHISVRVITLATINVYKYL